eukprot:TRINITY_DN14033_c0_g1_i2.p1 TRINITY_DN14033_c0_g1~~TRINITY_DN14033_c0_g1_i2.p1  ORF type:complete len:145 (+),score=4.45 TRINITY_DN14033_c0_g1_i2:84-518(+)
MWAGLQYFSEDNPRYGRFRMMMHWAPGAGGDQHSSAMLTSPLADWDRVTDKKMVCFAGYGRCEWDVRPYVLQVELHTLARLIGVPLQDLPELWNVIITKCALIEELSAHMPAVHRRFGEDLRSAALLSTAAQEEPVAEGTCDSE